MLKTAASKTLIHAFILSRVDYCNSVYNGACACHLRPLQSVLHAAARLVLKKTQVRSHHAFHSRRSALAPNSQTSRIQIVHDCLQMSAQRGTSLSHRVMYIGLS